MRAVLVFGDFRWWDFDIKEDMPRTITIMSPMGHIDLKEHLDTHPHYPMPRRMEFDYRRRLDYDLVEYVFSKFI